MTTFFYYFKRVVRELDDATSAIRDIAEKRNNNSNEETIRELKLSSQ